MSATKEKDVYKGSTPLGFNVTVNRYAVIIKWVSIALIAVSVLLIVRQLPIGPAVQAMEDWIRDLGIWGPVVFGLLYVVAVVLLVPASALTLAAGALFGLVGGTSIVSLASTTGAALAFLISRRLARNRIAKKVEQYPKFDAIDKAISEGGWKIVALLRLSPAIPFNLQNYLYGLTGIRFWTCVLTSWLAMLPGTFMYVYLGHVGRAGLEATAGGDQSRSPAEWAMMIVGLAATIAVTVYITRLARKALKQHSDIASMSEAKSNHHVERKGWPWGTTITALIALAALSAAAFVKFNPDLLRQWLTSSLGPPSVILREAYEEKPDGPTFDHATLDDLLKSHVDEDGWVDYQGLKQDAVKLDAYIQRVANAPFDEMGRNQKLALLLNAYNAFTLRLILDYYAVPSIQAIPADQRWDDVRWQVGSHTWSLYQIENEQIRPKFKEPRIHFALVCAAVGCPRLRDEAYRADRMDQQLEDQSLYVHGHGRWFQFDPDQDVVRLTRLYLWYGGDFKQVAGSVLSYAARYSPELKRALDTGSNPRIEWLPYGWALNSKENAR
ncbi:MAG: VTT domain-containing protein [Planctomycetia bacterium]|nr:VTT domain-containing protein [Planctomycetia bacterium]